MSSMTATAPSRRLTRADWKAMPEHKHKTELLDGVVVDAFAPGPDMAGTRFRHQGMLMGIYDLIRPVVPAGWIWAGRPARAFRELKAEERAEFARARDIYVTYSNDYRRANR